MSIQKRPNGMWRARYRDGDGKEHSKHERRKVDAQRWLDEKTAAVVTGTYVDPRAGKITLESFYADWSQRQVWTRGTDKAMSLAVRSATFSDMELRKLRRSHIETWIKAMNGKGLAPGTIKTRVANVRSVLRAAVRDKLIAVDPSEGVTLPRKRKSEHAMVIPSPGDVGAILGAADDWFRPFVGLAAFAGLRRGEAVGVQLGDVDFLRRTLHVQRQVQRGGNGQSEITPPKYGSERVVHLPERLVNMLAHHVEHVGVRGDEEWLFGASYDSLGKHWDATLKAAGLAPVNLHSMRHFYASGLISAGCDVVTVQRALGHATATTTLAVYSHLWPSAADRTRAAASAMMAECFGAPADSVRTETPSANAQ